VSHDISNVAEPVDVPVLIGGFGLFMTLFVLRQVQLTKALASGTKAKPLIPRALLSLDCWNLLVIYVASLFTWASTDVSPPSTTDDLTADTKDIVDLAILPVSRCPRSWCAGIRSSPQYRTF